MTAPVSLTRRRVAAGLALALAIGIVPTAAVPNPAAAVGVEYQPIVGAGSTWSANAVQQWIRNVFDNFRWKVTYDDQGSTAGRNLFAQGSKDFGVSEIPYALANSDAPDPRPARKFAYVPIVAGGTAFMYNLAIGGKRVTNLRLSGETVAKIFTGVITKWNDPTIASDNPKLQLPAIQIVPVVRSDGSGTSAQLSAWMRAQYPAIWNAYCAKAGRSNCGITSNYPVVPGSAFIAQQGSNNVSALVAQDKSVGAITYVEASFPKNAGFPVAKLLNAAGFYTEPTAANVAVSLLAAVINRDDQSPDYLTANLAPVYNNSDPRTYPLSSYSYMIIPTALEGTFTEDKGLTLADFTTYFLCEGQQQAEVLGYSPLPVNLATAGLEQVLKIPGGNPDNKSISDCNNPTFSPDGTNKLANEAPQPQPCDKRGPDQCLTGTGGASGTTTAASTPGSAPSTTSLTSSSSGTGSAEGELSSTEALGAGGVTGLSAGGNPIVAGSPQELPERGLGVSTIFLMLLAGMLVLVVVLVPPMIARRRAAMQVAGVPRGRTRRTRAATAAPVATSARRTIPKVNLPDFLRKGSRAVPRSGDS